MLPDKYNVAHRHAHIMKALGSFAELEDDVGQLLDIAVRNGIASLRFHGCNADDARSLLADAIHFELNTSGAAHRGCRDTLGQALQLLQLLR